LALRDWRKLVEREHRGAGEQILELVAGAKDDRELGHAFEGDVARRFELADGRCRNARSLGELAPRPSVSKTPIAEPERDLTGDGVRSGKYK
jgi:hypothetical protein